MTTSLDSLNFAFECVGALLIWDNVRALLRAKHVEGVSLWVMTFYGVLGLWSAVYYACLGHFYSLAGQIVMVLGTWTWLGLVLWYRRK